jgi:cardiolipin synthase
MKLIVLPDDGIGSITSAIRRAKTSIDMGISRLDRADVARVLRAAARRGVHVRVLMTRGPEDGGRRLCRLETDLVRAGASVRRTGGQPRYHDKLMVVDGLRLHLLGFDHTDRAIERSRSFGLVTRRLDLVREAMLLFEADWASLPDSPSSRALVVSPDGARARLDTFLRSARSELLVYDPRLTDSRLIGILKERASAGVKVHVLGRVGPAGAGLEVRALTNRPLRAHAIVRDGVEAFLGSQGLRRVELDGRREVGALVEGPRVVARLRAVFEQDWSRSPQARADDDEAPGVEAGAAVDLARAEVMLARKDEP